MPGAPRHVVQSGAILNVWTEQPPKAPLRQLVRELRRRARRALAGTSANLSGQPTITDPDEVIAVFGQRVSTVLLEDFDEVPPERRRSATILDFTSRSRTWSVRAVCQPASWQQSCGVLVLASW